MKPVRCSKCKFFYDEDKYSSCPHCSDGAEAEHAALAAPAAPAPVDARTSATPEPAVQQSPEELQAILAAGFGDGVRVEEVRE